MTITAAMRTGDIPAAHPINGAAEEEAAFYGFYDWALNPVLTLQQLIQRLTEDLQRQPPPDSPWQHEEWRINLHLHACAIACVIDDYLALRPFRPGSDAGRPRLQRAAMALVLPLLSLRSRLSSLCCERHLQRTRDRWQTCVDRICDALVRGEDLSEPVCSDLLRELDDVRRSLFDRVLARRMRIPDGYREQDLTHHDAIALIRKLVDGGGAPARGARVCVIGLRTAGAYFAAVVRAWLAAEGWTEVSWMSLRPKDEPTPCEWRQLRALAAASANVIVIDDHSNTGATMAATDRRLAAAGIIPARITVLAPTHPARRTLDLRQAARPGVTVITLDPEACHKADLLARRAVEPILAEYFGAKGFRDVRIIAESDPEAASGAREAWRMKELHIRLKRAYDLEMVPTDPARRQPVIRHVVAKSVGWGWFGYHAYLAGTRLAGHVPEVLGLRNGFLFMQRVEVQFLQAGAPAGEHISALAAYVARRVEVLPTTEDPCYPADPEFLTYYTRTGWLDVLEFLRSAYRWYLFGKLKADLLRRRLRTYVSACPTLIDGKMVPSEWVHHGGRLIKIDFEHHNFVRAGNSFVDPAFDLAMAMFEFALSDRDRQALVADYVARSGDADVERRLIVYHASFLSERMRRSAHYMADCEARSDRTLHHDRYQRARDDLSFALQSWCRDRLLARGAAIAGADLAGGSPNASAGAPVFLLDLDGVFDRFRLGMTRFPHTTISGLIALFVLCHNGFQVALATGRSSAHVERYCRIYGLPAGIAEHGAIVVDAAGGRTMTLIDDDCVEQLQRARMALADLPGVFLDAGYQASIRAVRYHGSETQPPPADAVRQALDRAGCRRLRTISGPYETFVVADDVNKATAVPMLRQVLGNAEIAGAIGDSTPDIPVLECARFAYAPANCSLLLRQRAAGDDRWRIMREPYQRGLLAAVRDFVERCRSEESAPQLADPAVNRRLCDRRSWRCDGAGGGRDVFESLFHIAERSKLEDALAALAPWSL